VPGRLPKSRAPAAGRRFLSTTGLGRRPSAGARFFETFSGHVRARNLRLAGPRSATDTGQGRSVLRQPARSESRGGTVGGEAMVRGACPGTLRYPPEPPLLFSWLWEDEEKRRFREGRVMGLVARRVRPSATPCLFEASRLVDPGSSSPLPAFVGPVTTLGRGVRRVAGRNPSKNALLAEGRRKRWIDRCVGGVERMRGLRLKCPEIPPMGRFSRVSPQEPPDRAE